MMIMHKTADMFTYSWWIVYKWEALPEGEKKQAA